MDFFGEGIHVRIVELILKAKTMHYFVYRCQQVISELSGSNVILKNYTNNLLSRKPDYQNQVD